MWISFKIGGLIIETLFLLGTQNNSSQMEVPNWYQVLKGRNPHWKWSSPPIGGLIFVLS